MLDTPATTPSNANDGTLSSVQANILRVAKYGGAQKKPRDWSLHLFFRVLKASEVETTKAILKALTADDDGSSEDNAEGALGIYEGGSLPDALGSETTEAPSDAAPNTSYDPEKPADAFFRWLAMISGVGAPVDAAPKTDAQTASGSGTVDLQTLLSGAATANSIDLTTLPEQLDAVLSQPGGLDQLMQQMLALLIQHFDSPDRLRRIVDQLTGFGAVLQQRPRLALALYGRLSELLERLFSDPAAVLAMTSRLGHTPAEIGRKIVAGGLPAVCLYELLRHTVQAGAGSSMRTPGDSPTASPYAALRDTPQGPSLQTDTNPAPGENSNHTSPAIDTLPINLAFTHSGLKALQLHPTTLDSFPDVFKQGMAARAERLGDTGPSAPENWENEFGLPSIHGYFSGGFQAGSDGHPVDEADWKRLRADIRSFNGRTGSRGRFLRKMLGVLFRQFGMEILHIELGQTPYRTDGSGRELRLEHFGFRDGISQPFIDMKLGTPPPGGGKVRRDRTWAPVAMGEIFLGHADEDGNKHMQPFCGDLRHNGTYLVFRKLEQDVVGFRTFLQQQRPDSKAAQDRLAAQFMGRWQNGTPLVVSPDTPLELEGERDPRLNDFLYHQDDPYGRKCPLGSHARRSNPRDIGGHDSVKRHRILRRSMSYGGPLLDEGSTGDGEPKGLLFVAVNSRIDLQFEVIQGNWINKGEFLGQAGLGRCPVIGANDAGVSDSFLESDAVAPVNHIPRFVTTRGGDYFFVPSAHAMRKLATGWKFPPDPGEAVDRAQSIGSRQTPALFDEARIREFVLRIVSRQDRSITVDLPKAPDHGEYPQPHSYREDPHTGRSILFVGQHADVHRVLRDNPNGSFLFSVPHYRIASRRTSRGIDLLIGTEKGPLTGATRDRLQFILNGAWNRLQERTQSHERIRSITEACLDNAMQRTAPSGRIDLVRDFATETVYRISADIFGVPGPNWLTEIAAALPFAKKHIFELEPDWLTTLKRQPPENPALATLHLWSVIFLADLVGNLPFQDELKELARSAGSEFMTHLDNLVSDARRRRPAQSQTLLDTFVDLEAEMVQQLGGEADYGPDDYYRDVIALLLELSGTIMSVVPTAWGRVINTILDNRIDLPTLVPLLKATDRPNRTLSGIDRLIYETDRVNPAFKIFQRYCETDTPIDDELTIPRDTWVGAMAIAANFDPQAFPEPKRFSLAPNLPGPPREAANYLMFGAQNGARDCWGRDRLALFLMRSFIERASRLYGLRKPAGPQSVPEELARVIIGLPARFSPRQ